MSYKNTPDGFLAFMIRKLLITTNIDAGRLKLLIDRYIREQSITNEYTKHHDRVNYFKEIYVKGHMSIKGFFRTLVILRYVKIEMIIVATDRNGKRVTIADEVILPDKNTMDDDQPPPKKSELTKPEA